MAWFRVTPSPTSCKANSDRVSPRSTFKVPSGAVGAEAAGALEAAGGSETAGAFGAVALGATAGGVIGGRISGRLVAGSAAWATPTGTVRVYSRATRPPAQVNSSKGSMKPAGKGCAEVHFTSAVPG